MGRGQGGSMILPNGSITAYIHPILQAVLLRTAAGDANPLPLSGSRNSDYKGVL